MPKASERGMMALDYENFEDHPEEIRTYYVVMVTHRQLAHHGIPTRETIGRVGSSYQTAALAHRALMRKAREVEGLKAAVARGKAIPFTKVNMLNIIKLEVRQVTDVVSRRVATLEEQNLGEPITTNRVDLPV